LVDKNNVATTLRFLPTKVKIYNEVTTIYQYII